MSDLADLRRNASRSAGRAWVLDPEAARAVGARGRQLFTGRRLWRRANHPRSERFYWRYLKPVAAAALILWFTPQYAFIVWRRFGVPPHAQAVQQCRLAFRDWVNPRCYYFHEHYRKPGPVDCSAYVMRHEIKEGLLRSLHKLRPKLHGERVNLGHKQVFAEICRRFALPTPTVAAIAHAGQVTIFDHAALAGDLFIKPEKGRGALGAKAFHRRADGRFAVGDDGLSLADLLESIAIETGSAPKLLQPLLRNHPQIADLAEQSLLTIRIITCFSPEGRPIVTHAMLRAISKLEPDWPGADEYAAPIDLQSGRLGMMCGDTAIGPQHWYDFHPITCARVAGRLMPQWPAIRELAVRAHDVFADRMIVGWDIALTADGPTLLEGNSYPDTEFLQRVHRQPIGDSPLGPPLAYHLGRLEALRGRFGADLLAPLAKKRPQ
jgi:hypothetical protein